MTTSFNDAFDLHVVPIAARLGMKLMKKGPKSRANVVARALSRDIEEGRALVLQCWCDKTTGLNLTWRLDVRVGELWHDLSLTFPFERVGHPPARPSGGSHTWLQDFHPHRSPERLSRAMEFLGGVLATLHAQIGEQVPALKATIAEALASPEWRDGLASAPRLWDARLVEGAVDPTEVAAVVVSASGSLLVLTALGARITLKCAALGVSAGDEALLSGWWTNVVGVRTPTVVRVGDATWRFDFFGRLVHADPR